MWLPTRISWTSWVSMRSSCSVHSLRFRAVLCCWNFCRHWKALRPVCPSQSKGVTGAPRAGGCPSRAQPARNTSRDMRFREPRACFPHRAPWAQRGASQGQKEVGLENPTTLPFTRPPN